MNEPKWKTVARVAIASAGAGIGLAQIAGVIPPTDNAPWWAPYVLAGFMFSMGHSTVFNLVTGPFARLLRVVRGGNWEDRSGERVGLSQRGSGGTTMVGQPDVRPKKKPRNRRASRYRPLGWPGRFAPTVTREPGPLSSKLAQS